MTGDVSHLLLLPNEIFFEIFRYLSYSQVAYSFYQLNERFKTCIRSSCRHLSLTDVTFAQFDYLCRVVLPDVGSSLHSLSLNNCRCVLEGKLFYEYFSDRMSHVFPNLRKLSLVCFTADELRRVCQTLNHLHQLDQLEIRDVLTDENTLFEDALAANDHRCTSIHFKTSHLALPLQSCPQLLNLTVSLKKLEKLPALLQILPNVRELHVTIDEISFPELELRWVEPLTHLTKFFLRCFNHYWSLDEVSALFKILPIVEQLSLQISSQDKSFVSREQALLNLLPTSVQEFNFSLRYYYDFVDDIDRQALLAARFPMVCLIDDELDQAVIHTVPYRFPLLNITTRMAKQMASAENYRALEKFYDYQGMSLAEIVPIVVRAARIHEIDIQCDKTEPTAAISEALPALCRFSCLRRIWFMHPSRDCLALRAILQAAPRLSELFIAFDNLLPIFDDRDTCALLGERIVHLLVLRTAPSAPTAVSETHLPTLVNVFARLRHLQIDVTNGSPIESIVLAVMDAFKDDRHRLISLVVEGQTACEEMKSNARQWLIDRSFLTETDKFDAQFREQTNRFLLWM